MTERVRFAPSPTGNLHLGGVRTALYNFLYARHHGGAFLLRIEDTDRERSEEHFLDSILGSMGWLGLGHDEELVFQSRRLERYQERAQELLDQDKAYRQTDEGKGEAIYIRVPDEPVTFRDQVYGEITKDLALQDDFVIVKSDGFPVYHFAAVTDDIDMEITLVMRGDDHIPNTPRQIAIYRALGAQPPRFAHLPMINGSDGKKLSKRHGAVSAVEYEQQGFLPDALLNYLALLGWSPGDNREVLTREELTQLFGLERVRKSAAQFDLEKLTWLNSEHARALPLEEAVAGVVPFLEVAGLWPAEGRDADWLVELIQTVEFGNRCKTFAEFPAEADFFLVDTFEYQPKSVKKVLRKAGAEEILREVFGLLQELVEWGAEALEALLRQVSERREVGFGKVAQPLRVALSGRHTTPGITETMQLLGRDRSLARIERCLQEIYGNTGESGQ